MMHFKNVPQRNYLHSEKFFLNYGIINIKILTYGRDENFEFKFFYETAKNNQAQCSVCMC